MCLFFKFSLQCVNADNSVSSETQLSTKLQEGRLHIIKRPVEHYLNHLKLVSIARVNNTLGSKMRALGVINPICECKYALEVLHSFSFKNLKNEGKHPKIFDY